MDLPKNNGFEEKDAKLLVKHYGKPLPKERKAALMQKLEAQREKALKNQQGNEQDKGNEQAR